MQAVLGFIKVLVSCIEPKDLQNFVSVIVDGILPWSSVSRHHFRSKACFLYFKITGVTLACPVGVV